MKSLLFTIILGAQMLLADAPLKTFLTLSMDQARQVHDIQAAYRLKFAAKRQDFNRESRALRRANIENDSKRVAELEKVTAALREQLRQIRAAEDQEIERLLNAEQRKKFEEYKKLRKEMVGSSRDDKDL